MGKEQVSQSSTKSDTSPKETSSQSRPKAPRRTAASSDPGDGYRLRDIPVLPPPNEPSSLPSPQLERELANTLGPDTSSLSTDSVQSIASAGLTGVGEPLPQLSTLQRAFGGIDLSTIRVHRDESAKTASDKLSAQAFTRGEHIALAGQPSLHDLAHETAHVVQQRHAPSGLPTGLTDPSHPLEKQADSIAHQVSQGGSALPILSSLPFGPQGTASTPSTALPVMRIRKENAQYKIQKSKDKQEYLRERLVKQFRNNRVKSFEAWQWFMMYTELNNGQSVYEYYRYSWEQAAKESNIGPYPDINAKTALDNTNSSNNQSSNLGKMKSSTIISKIESNSNNKAHNIANLGNTTKELSDLAPVSDSLVKYGRKLVVDPITDKIDQKQRLKYSNNILDNDDDLDEEEDNNNKQMLDLSPLNNEKPKPQQQDQQFDDFLFGMGGDLQNQDKKDNEETLIENSQNPFDWASFDNQYDNEIDKSDSNWFDAKNGKDKNIKSSLLGNEADYVSGLKQSGKKIGNKGIDMLLSAPVTVAKQFTKGILTIGKGFGALIESSGKSYEAWQLLKLAEDAYREADEYSDQNNEQLYDKSASGHLLEAIRILCKYPWGGNAQVIMSSAANSGMDGGQLAQFGPKLQISADQAADSEDLVSGSETKSHGFYSEAKKNQSFKVVHKKIQGVKDVFGHSSAAKDKVANAVYDGLTSPYDIDQAIAKAIVYGPLKHTNETMAELGLDFSKPLTLATYIRNVELSGDS